MSEFLPIMLKTTAMNCLVVGGGKVAQKKVLVLLRFGVRVTVVADQLVSGLERLVKQELISYLPRKFTPIDLLFKKMVIAATNDRKVNQRVIWWAQRLNLFYNTVDDVEGSNFIFPAIYRSGLLTVGISTQGAYPALAKQIKRQFALNYGNDYRFYLSKLSSFRDYIKSNVSDLHHRRSLLRKLLKIDIELLMAWDEAELREWLNHESS